MLEKKKLPKIPSSYGNISLLAHRLNFHSQLVNNSVISLLFLHRSICLIAMIMTPWFIS